MSTPPPEQFKRLQNLTGAAITVLVISIYSLLAAGSLGKSELAGPRHMLPAVVVVPYLLIIALIATGFRPFGDALALGLSVVAFGITALFAMLAGLGGGNGKVDD